MSACQRTARDSRSLTAVSSGDVRHLVVDWARAARELGFTAVIDLRDGLRELAFVPVGS
jgi:nucleoside-diphosphate-sugar epimerase